MTLKRWFAGFFLLLLMVTALFINSILFSARSFQHNLFQVDPASGGVISLAELAATETQVAELERQTAPQRGEAAIAEQKAAEAKLALDTAQDAVTAQQVKILSAVAALEETAGLPPAAATGAFDTADVAQRLERISAQRATAAQTRDGVIATRSELIKLADTEETLAPKEQELARLEAEKRRIGEFIETSNRAILGLKGQFGDNFQRIRNEARALEQSSPFGLGSKLVSMHPTFLTTVLVCLMGALGALLYLFPAYLNRDNNIYFADIVVRLVFGMVTALAFYIVANASIAGLTFMPGQEASSNVGASLNPFAVSLIGITAGIMADDIAAWIRERGREVFGGSRRNEAPAAPAGTSMPNPHGGPVGLMDPFTVASRDARVQQSDPGDTPPRGGVVG
jgi:hypothetical protein